jgi:hypothetical protein
MRVADKDQSGDLTQAEFVDGAIPQPNPAEVESIRHSWTPL